MRTPSGIGTSNSRKDGGFEERPPRPYDPDAFRRTISKSAIVRYLVMNLRVREKVEALRHWNDQEGYEDNVDPEQVLADRDVIERAVSVLVQRTREENPGTEILFAIDGRRRDIYAGTQEGKLVWLHDALGRAAAEHGCDFLDLTVPFRADWEAHHQPFNSELNFHWDEHGHRVAADAVLAFLRERDVFGKPDAP